MHNLQYGFLSGKSTTSQLLKVLHEFGESLDKRIQTDVLYFAKAFDRVDHQLLLKKLSNFGVCGNLLSWFHNYLTDRHQKVTILGKTSRSIPVLSGVPQGSILGPLLFLVYVNDLLEKSTTSSVALDLFADDTKCYHAIRTTDDVKALQCDLDGISQWCRTWRMNLNETKCGVLKVTRNLKPVQSSYHLNNDNSANSTVICKMLVQKDLGVLITADLKWNQQVSAVCAKANRMLGFVKRLKSCKKIKKSPRA